MPEETTFDHILDRLLQTAKTTFPELDTREGSLIYTALAPAALEMARLYTALNFALEMSYADTASRDYLIRRAAERGLAPFPATPAVVEAEIQPEDLTLPQGARFRAGAVIYAVSGTSAEGFPLLTAEPPGRIGNQFGGRLLPVVFIEGLQTATIRSLAVPGRDEERTEAFRQRYMESHRVTGFGGNIVAYQKKVLALPGIGGVRIFPAYAGPGSVKVGILGADYFAPSETLVQSVQAVLDPPETTVEGRGWAPIGHRVTVVGATHYPIAVATNLVLETAADPETVRGLVEQAIETYFLELRQAWNTEDPIVVRISQIDTRILDVSGVLDVKNTELNGRSGNLLLADMQVPMPDGLVLR